MDEYIIGVVVGIVLGVLLAALLMVNSSLWEGKTACEESLPRDVSCTWQPPQGEENE